MPTDLIGRFNCHLFMELIVHEVHTTLSMYKRMF